MFTFRVSERTPFLNSNGEKHNKDKYDVGGKMNRAKLRENTFKLLYCNDFHKESEMPKQFELFWENLSNIEEKEKEYIISRVNDISKNKSIIDKAISEVSIGWSIDRMSKVDLTILRLAYYEMKMDDSIPNKVAVDQAVELAKKYGSDNSPNFINGILSKFF